MPDPIVRNVDESINPALEERAARRDLERPSAEVLQDASPTLKALLLSDDARAEIPVPPRRVGSRRVPPDFE